MSERTVYSVWIRQGPDRVHYDLVFEDDGIRLVYLGEYWERIKPRGGLQRQADMLLYSLRKRRRRSSNLAGNDIVINYCDIKSYALVKPSDYPRVVLGVKNVGVLGENYTPRGLLELVLRDGRRLRIEFSAKVYEIVKKLVKEYLSRAIEACGNAVRRAR